jgi:hypothetical protein
MTVPLVYDPRYHSFESWAALMVEAYAAQQLQIPMIDTDWKSWGAGLKAIDVFANEAIPEPYQFDDWQEWAAALVGAVNPRAI